ncbi:hypothetical protein RHS04_09304 [Rhizoctonia solani]|uniref:Uncharacterized protein n=1 Tax=Rhizoctonia solani TaxID=456999 RepID=A0A8H7GY95_9AGAM|nr:hypothetical protein RHS04_09304 [Rhizoctonia solani]
MFSQGLSTVLAKVLARPRNPASNSEANRSSLPDSFDVGLTYDWSDSSLNTANIKPSLPPKEDLDLFLGNACTPLSSSKVLANDLETPFAFICEQDALNAPLRTLTSSPPTIYRSSYGKRLPMLIFKKEDPPRLSISDTPHLTRSTFAYASTKSNLKHSDSSRQLTIGVHRSFTPLQLDEACTGGTSARKRKGLSVPPADPRARGSKRHCLELDVIDIESHHSNSNSEYECEQYYKYDSEDNNDDGDDDDVGNDDNDWTPQMIDTGYQTSQTTGLSVEHTPAVVIKTSSTYSRAGSRPSLKQYSSVSPTPTLPGSAGSWPGPEGGAIKFKSKPPKFNENAFSRWSYSTMGPKNSAVGERASGDIHFSPSNGIGTNEPFNYWVCSNTSHGMRWVDFSCGQPHPLYRGFVLKPANAVTKVPPRWVKMSSYRRGT